MKCTACGYEDENFIEIEGHFTYREELDYYPDRTHYINLYGCPKCGTIKMDLN